LSTAVGVARVTVLWGLLGTVVALVLFTFGMSALATFQNWVPDLFHPWLAIALTYSGVTAYRFLYEDREKRKVTALFGHYLKPEIVNQLAKMRLRSQGRVAVPVVVRIQFGGGIGTVEHHSESPEALFALMAGLRVVACSGPADAYTMIQQSIRCDDPVIFFEPKRRYWDKAEVDTADALAGALPLEAASTVAEGTDVTVLTYGPLVRTCVEAAVAARDDGRAVEVIDLRSLSPLDLPTIVASVRRTGRCVVVHEAPVTGGLGAEIAARVSERCFYQLEAPVLRVGGFSAPYPPSRLEDHYLPDLDRVLDAVDRTFTF